MFARLRTFLFSENVPPAGMQDVFSHLPTLETDRLVLRMARNRDASDIFMYASDPQVSEHVLWECHEHYSDSLAYVRYLKSEYREGKPSSWVMVLKETRKVIGTIGYMEWNEEHKVVEVGYSLGADYWNRGLMTEALSCVMDFTFSCLPVHRIEAQHEDSNAASGRVMEKCGMIREGVLQGRVWNKNHYSDVVMYGVTRERYAMLASAPASR